MCRAARAGRPPVALAAIIARSGAAALAAVWTMQARGYAPCELCLKERVPFEVGVLLAAALALASPRLPRAVVQLSFAALALCFACGAVLGAYHTDVERHLWAGPSGCSGIAPPPDVGDFLRQLDAVVAVRCDEAALEVAGLSLAAWNASLAAGLAAAAALGWRRATGRDEGMARGGPLTSSSAIRRACSPSPDGT